jgi:hypothetical protein
VVGGYLHTSSDRRAKEITVTMDRGWSADASVVIGYRVVLYLHKGHTGAPGGVTVHNVAGGIGTNLDGIATARDWLETNSLATIGTQPVQGFYMIRLTETGAAAGDRWTRTIGDDTERRRACRSAILDWLALKDADWVPFDFASDTRAHYFGDKFTEQEIRRAATTLRERGLIGSKGSAEHEFLRVIIEEDGRECLERFDGDVDAWRDHQRGYGGDVYTTTITHSPGAQSIAGSPHSQQASTVTITADSRRQLLQMADALDTTRPVLGLSPDDDAQAQAVIVRLREAAEQGEADPSRVQRLLQDVRTIAVSGSGSAAGMGIVALARQVAQALGLG